MRCDGATARFRTEQPTETLAALAALLAEQRVELVELQVKKASLEDVFVGLTKRDDGVASPAAEQASVAPKASAGSKGSPR